MDTQLVLYVVTSLALTFSSATRVPQPTLDTANLGHEFYAYDSPSKGPSPIVPYASFSSSAALKSLPGHASVKLTTPNAYDYGAIPQSQSYLGAAQNLLPYRAMNSELANSGLYSSSVQISDIHSPSSFGNVPSPTRNIDAYKGVIKPTVELKSIPVSASEKFQIGNLYSPSRNAINEKKIQDDFSGFTDDHSPLSTIRDASSQGQASNAQVPEYKTNYHPLPKVSKYSKTYAAAYQNSDSSLRPAEKFTKHSQESGASPLVGSKDKKVATPIAQSQTSRDISEYLKAFESEPVVLNDGNKYRTETNFGYNFGSASAKSKAPRESVVSHLPLLSTFQGHVLPIQTSSGTPEFPQFKGASVQGVRPGNSNVAKLTGTYEPLRTQPQLHFGSAHAPYLLDIRQNPRYPSPPVEEIREDVEIIDKKNKRPPPPTPESDDHDGEDNDERYKSIETEYGSNSKDNDDRESDSGKFFKESSSHGDFKPSQSFPFKEYDETFGKYSKQRYSENSDERPSSKFRSYPSAKEDDSDEDSPASNVNSNVSSKGRYESSEDTAEEEEDDDGNKKYGKYDEAKDSDYNDETQRFAYFEKDFDRDFDVSSKRELPKNKYAKQVTETYHDDRRRSNDKEKNVRGPTNLRYAYEDNEGRGSIVSFEKTPNVAYDQFFDFPTGRRHPENNYVRAVKSSYKLHTPKNENNVAYQDGEFYSYLSGNGEKSIKSSPEDIAVFSASTKGRFAKPHDQTYFYVPSSVNVNVRSLTNEEVLRDLRGI